MRHRTALQIEATLGAMFAFLYGFVVMVAGVAIPSLNWGKPDFWTIAPPALLIVTLEFIFLWHLKISLENDHVYPFAPHFALKWRRMAFWQRPLWVGFSVGHWLSGIAAIIAMDHNLFDQPQNTPLGIIALAVCIGLSFTISYSTNLYALMVMALFGGAEKIIRPCWRWRLVFDLLVAVAALVVWKRFTAG